MHDLVIRGGTVVDGTGAPGRTADVAIDGQTITEVGRAGPGRREVEADGLLVTPGFVDVHTHYDAQATWDSGLSPSSWHGCTTVMMGNCGVGFAPAAPDRHQWLIRLMEGVEDIPGTALTEGIQWGWESFPEYLHALEAIPHTIDFGTQIPHGALRAYVMGERGANNEAATADDIAAMGRLVEEALRAGAFGFSTSRTSLHNSADGVPVPGTFAAREELFGIGDALTRTGAGVFQLAAEHLDVPKELEWMGELSKRTGRPVMFNLSQTDMAPELWRDILPQLEGIAASGGNVVGQVAGRAIGVLMGWETSAHPFMGHPTFKKLLHLSPAERLVELRKPEVKAQLLEETPDELRPADMYLSGAFSKMYVYGQSINYEPSRDDRVDLRAEKRGVSVKDIAYDAMMDSDGRGMVYLPLFNYADENLDVLHTLHQHPRTMMGLSDAGAHCGAICDGGMPTFMLTYWTRDRASARLPLEHVVRRQTQDTARMFGLTDRGVLAPGKKADVNVIDYAKLHLEQPRVVYDLPAGGRRLLQGAHGYRMTVVSGTPIRENDADTGQLPGKLLRASV